MYNIVFLTKCGPFAVDTIQGSSLIYQVISVLPSFQVHMLSLNAAILQGFGSKYTLSLLSLIIAWLLALLTE